MIQVQRGSAKVCSAKSVKEFLVTTVTRISDHNCDEDYQVLPIEMPCLLLLHCTGPLPIASACRQGNSREKKNCSIFAPFNYFSQTLSVLFKHFSQFSSLSRMFPNPRLPLRLLNEDIMLLLLCLLCQSLLKPLLLKFSSSTYCCNGNREQFKFKP